MISFTLTPHIYAAEFLDSIIILDSDNDNYLSLIDDAAHYFKIVLQHQFTTDGTNWYCAQLPNDTDEITSWIEHFVESQFIVQQSSMLKKTLAPQPIKTGGLHDYQWDTKSTWSPFKQARKWEIITACIQLAKVHRMIKRSGIKELLEKIKKSNKASTYQPTDLEVSQLAAAIDAASLLYPQKTLCLAWAATFALMAGKKKWLCSFVIGVQTNPFYAHAWAETADGTVINDDPAIGETLSMILREPHKGN